jgi:hypothetical protein
VATHLRTNITLDSVRDRLVDLLPAPFVARAATLMEEFEPDRWQVRETLLFGTPTP